MSFCSDARCNQTAIDTYLALGTRLRARADADPMQPRARVSKSVTPRPTRSPIGRDARAQRVETELNAQSDLRFMSTG